MNPSTLVFSDKDSIVGCYMIIVQLSTVRTSLTGDDSNKVAPTAIPSYSRCLLNVCCCPRFWGEKHGHLETLKCLATKTQTDAEEGGLGICIGERASSLMLHLAAEYGRECSPSRVME